jgi:hypothetical protein
VIGKYPTYVNMLPRIRQRNRNRVKKPLLNRLSNGKLTYIPRRQPCHRRTRRRTPVQPTVVSRYLCRCIKAWTAFKALTVGFKTALILYIYIIRIAQTGFATRHLVQFCLLFPILCKHPIVKQCLVNSALK